MGNVGRDSELQFTPGGLGIAKFSIAVSEKIKKGGEWQEVTEWFNCVMFGPRAEKLSQHITKGSMVLVEGKLRTNSYEKDGQKKKYTDLIVDSFEFAGKRGGGQRQQQEAFGGDDIPF